jgi:hypothetical protein
MSEHLFQSFERRVLFAAMTPSADAAPNPSPAVEAVFTSATLPSPSAQAVLVGDRVELRFHGDVTGTVYFIGGSGYYGHGWRVEAPIVGGVAVLDEVPPYPVVYLSWYYSGDANYAPIEATAPRRGVPMPINDNRPFDITIKTPAEPLVPGKQTIFEVQFTDPQLKAGEWFGGHFDLEVDGHFISYPWWVGPNGKGIFYWTPTAGTHSIRVHFDRNGTGGVCTDPFHASTVSPPFTFVAAGKPSEVRLSTKQVAVPAGQPLILDATLTAPGATYDDLRTGGVRLVDDKGTELLGAQDVDQNGNTVFVLTGMSPGTYRVRAEYAGSATVAPSASAFVTVTITEDGRLAPAIPLVASADADGDGEDDEVRYDRGSNRVWISSSRDTALTGYLHANAPVPGWRLAGTADFDGDGTTDLLWTNDSLRKQSIWRVRGAAILGFSMLNHAPRANAWVLDEVKDLDSDGDADLIWRNLTTGGRFGWLMNGTKVVGGMSF